MIYTISAITFLVGLYLGYLIGKRPKKAKIIEMDHIGPQPASIIDTEDPYSKFNEE